MRVISQNGAIDIPYETTAFHECGGKILMNMCGDAGRGTLMANYSTSDKAQKAMDMLHQVYTGMVFAKDIEFAEGFEEQLRSQIKNGFGIVKIMNNNNGTAEFSPMNIVWKFPEDADL